MSAVLLAGGTAGRFGGLKLLAEVGEASLLEAALSTLTRAQLLDIILVLGHQAEVVRRRVPTDGARVVVNPRYRDGMSTSIQAGLRALDGPEAGVLLALGDQPLVQVDTVNRLVDAFRRSHASAIVPRYRGRPGNPVVLDLRLRPRMEQLRGDVGCREILDELEDTRAVDVDDPGILLDVDTPEDLERIRARTRGREAR